MPLTSRYLEWSFEELRRLAQQLQVPDAAEKSRNELLDWLVGGAVREVSQDLERPARRTGDG